MCSWLLRLVAPAFMPTVCAAKNCGHRHEPTRKGCGGRQYVLAEYARYCKEMLKDGAEEGDWICVTCRDILKARASTFGADLNGDGKV